MIEKKPFIPYKLEEERSNDKGTIITVRLNEAEYRELMRAEKVLEQPKDSTALKQLAEIGQVVIHDDKLGAIMKVILKNRYKNRRTGAEVQGANVTPNPAEM